MTKDSKQSITDELASLYCVTAEQVGYEEYRSCQRKSQYSSESHVKEEAQRQNVRYYECKFCSCWHLSHRNGP